MEKGDFKFDKRRNRAKSCPCGKSNKDGKFAPFEGHDVYGHCFSCGKTFFPPDENYQSAKAPICHVPIIEISYTSHETLKASLKAYEENHFATFLVDRFKNDGVKAIGKYFIGTAKSGRTVFWQIDKTGRIRSGKIIQYDPMTGKRLKDIDPTWVHSAMKLEGYNLKQCLFGEHLLKGNSKPCAVVESEKSAVIASIYWPDIVWVACGGKDGLKPSKMEILKGRKVVLYPDADGYGLWCKKAEELSPMLDISVSTLIDNKATPEEKNGKLDIADYLLRFKPEDFHKKDHQEMADVMPHGCYIDTLKDGRRILMSPKGYPASWDDNPAVAELFRRFDLQILN